MESLVQAIHNKTAETGNKFVLSITGGGFTAFSQLMTKSGASNTILELNGPYAEEATRQFIETIETNEIKQFVSDEMADAIALKSLNRARELYVKSKSNLNDLENIDGCFGIGVTSALGSTSWKRGDHRCYITIQSSSIKHKFYLKLYKGTEHDRYRTRSEEDNICGSLIISLIGFVLGIIDISDINIDINDKFNYILENYQYSIDVIDRLISSKKDSEKVNSILCLPNGKYLINVPIHKLARKLIMVPGSFNPLHEGHIFLLDEGMKLAKTDFGIYELCIINADKGLLMKDEILRRLKESFLDRYPVILTNATTFNEKAKLFPGVSYSIGIDTTIRLIDPIYSNNNNKLMLKNLLKMYYDSTEFYVGSRTLRSCNVSDKYSFSSILEPSDLLMLGHIIDKIDPLISDMFTEIINNKYKDISSSIIRSNKN